MKAITRRFKKILTGGKKWKAKIRKGAYPERKGQRDLSVHEKYKKTRGKNSLR